ncbi:MAG TPA: hypothetical protein VFP53_05275, partial [Sphingomicrobium sp.]|nr:hypothetical protein [Sphingomicrobium sp.]
DLAGLTLTGLTTVKSNGSGGNATSGIGGSGYGGTADLGAQLGGDTVFASALIDSSGIGGSGSGGEGQGSGWDSTLSVVDGTLSGTSAIVQSNGTDSGGLAELESAGIGTGTSGDLDLGSVTMTANGGQSGGDVIVTVDYGSVADIGAASLTTSGPNGTGAVTIDVGSNASSVPFAGDLLFADSVTIDSTGSIDLISDNGAGMNAGSFDATAAGTISFDDQYFGATLTAPTITLQASDFAFGWSFDSASMGLTVDGNYNLSSLPYGADNLSVAATDNLIAGDLYASDSLALTAGGDLSVGYVSAGQDIAFSSSGNLTTGTLYAGGDIALDSAGNMTTGDLIAGGGVAAEAGGSMLVTSAVSGYDIPAESLGGVQTASAVVSGESVILDAAGDLTTGAIESAQDIVLTAGGDIDMSNLDAAQAISVAVGGSFSVAEVAGSSADFTAGNLAEFYGTVAVSTITVTSGGLYIADGASLGVSGITQLLTFNAVSDGPIFIGENNQEQPAGYALYSDGDIRSQSIVINAVAGDGATAPDVIFGDLMIEGSQTDGGGNSQVTLNTNGTIDVAGFVDFVNAGPADSMTLNAGDGIRIATGMGGISITDSSGDLAGMLVLSGDHIWVADQALISQLQSNPNFEGRDAALATNSGESVPNGFIRAGGVSATVVDSFLVQNSGTTDDLGGITVGDGGLTVTNGGTEPVTVIAYGRQVGSDGTTVDGAAFAGEVELGGAAGATSDSTINGCSLGSACGGAPPESGPVTGAESILGPIGLMNSPSDAGSNDSDDSDDEEESEDGGSGGDASNFLINTGPVRLETPINEPITSGSDSPVGLN